MPQVSVIVPLYNKGPYVRRALDSVFAQTFKDFEVIVVDDGSTDDGLGQVTTYDDPRLHLIRQENAGPGAARNRGVAESCAEYVAFLDADDEWLPGYLQKVMDTRKQHPGCEVVVSNWIADFSTHPAGLRNANVSDYMESTYGVLFSGQWKLDNTITTLELRLITSRFCTPVTSCTKYIFKKHQGFGTEGNLGEDWVLWLKFIFCESILFLNEPLVFVHDEASGLSRNGDLNQPLELYYYKYEDIKCACPDDHKKLLKKWFILHSLQSAHNRLAFEKYDDVYYLSRNFELLQTYTFYSYIKLNIKIFLSIFSRAVIRYSQYMFKRFI